ncbi:MAG: YesL family protein [Eubacterium sp.]|nr:YesL family protein [Eubacterium sp.]
MFSYDNIFFRIMTKVADVLIVSLFWVIFSVPIVTLGASTSALYYTVHKVIIGERGYVAKDFWKQFKDQFKDSLICTIIFEVLFAIQLYDVVFVKTLLDGGADRRFAALYYCFYFMLLLVILWFVYVFCYRARFEMNWKGSMINGGKFFLSSVGWSVLILVAFVVTIIIIRDMPFFALVLPAVNAMLWNFIMERLYYKVMTPEEREVERKNKQIQKGEFDDDEE